MRGLRPVGSAARLVGLWAALLTGLWAEACGARTDLARTDLDAGPVDASAPECLRDADCDDGFDCTDDRCDERVCQHRARSERCDDGRYCTGAGRCEVSRGCVFEGDPCDDGVACTIDRCDEARDLCTAEPDAALCPLSHRCDSARGCIARAIVHDNDWLYEVDLPSGEIATLTPARRRFTDVSLHPDGRLFAVTPSELFLLNERDGSTTFIARLPERVLALDVSPGGDLVAAGASQVFTIDPDTGATATLARFPGRFGASGDIAFVRGRMLVSANEAGGTTSSRPDRLFEVPADGRAPFDLGDIGFPCVWGMAPFGETLYGFTCRGILLEIDPVTGEGRRITTLGGRQIGGAAAR